MNMFWILIVAFVTFALIFATIGMIVMFQGQVSRPIFGNREIRYIYDWGEPIDYINFTRVNYKELPVKDHPVETGKYAKIQKPVFVPNAGYFVARKMEKLFMAPTSG